MLPNKILEKVKEFLIRLVKDSAFNQQLQASSDDRVQSLLQAAGYDFSQEEFESATLQILDLKEQNQFHELSEAELVGAVGGWFRRYPIFPGKFPIGPGGGFPGGPIVQPMYGVVIDPPKDEDPVPPPWDGPQPMYGVVIDPVDPIVQPMYGVVVSSDIM